MTPDDRILDIKSLNVIGYADRLAMGTTVRKVAPVFQRKGAPKCCLMPPSNLNGGLVLGGSRVYLDEVRSRHVNEDITLLGYSFPAQPDFVMWVDAKLQVYYQPRWEALEFLREMSARLFASAKHAFVAGELCMAEDLSRQAFAADDRLWPAIALQCAIDDRIGELAGACVLRKIGYEMVPDDEFESRVRSFLEDTR